MYQITKKKVLKAADCYSSNCTGIEQIMHLFLVPFFLGGAEQKPFFCARSLRNSPCYDTLML